MPTVADLLADPMLALRPLTGEGHTDREISWVHVSELPDPAEFLDGGELLLLTGVGLPGDAGQQADYVRGVVAAGVAALGFGVGLSHDTVPAAVVEAAAAADLPVLEVPRAVPFLAITRAVARAVHRRELADREALFDAQRRLTAAAVRRAGPVGVVDEVNRGIGGWALLLGRSGNVVAAAPGSAAEHRRALTPDLARLRRAPGAASVVVHDDLGERWMQSLWAADEHVGYLAVGRSSNLTSTQRQIVHAAVPLLVLALDRSRLVARGAARLRAGLLTLLLAGRVDLVEPVVTEIGNGCPLPPVTVVCCQGAGPAVGAAAERLVADLSVAAGRTLHAVLDEVLICVASRGDLDAVLSVVAPVTGLHVGVSGPAGLDDLDRAYREASTAAEAAATVAGRPGAVVARFGNLTRPGLVDLLPGDDAVRFSDDVLAPLRGPGVPGDLMDAVEVWLAHHGQWDPAAGVLGIHRHTLRKRITRAAGLLDRDLDSTDVRTELWLALRIANRTTAHRAR